jgi:hypothetical protein
MWRIRDEGISWRSVFLLVCVFLPAAFFSGYIPGWWWWPAVAGLFVAMCVSIDRLARHDRRRRRT